MFPGEIHSKMARGAVFPGVPNSLRMTRGEQICHDRLYIKFKHPTSLSCSRFFYVFEEVVQGSWSQVVGCSKSMVLRKCRTQLSFRCRAPVPTLGDLQLRSVKMAVWRQWILFPGTLLSCVATHLRWPRETMVCVAGPRLAKPDPRIVWLRQTGEGSGCCGN